MTLPPGRIVWLAVIAGFVVDTVISLVIIAIASMFDPQVTREQNFSTTAGVVTTVLLSFSTLLGGFIAGRRAKHEYILHGALVGGISIVTLMLDSFFVEQASLFTIVHGIVLVFMGALGGLISRWLAPAQQEV